MIRDEPLVVTHVIKQKVDFRSEQLFGFVWLIYTIIQLDRHVFFQDEHNSWLIAKSNHSLSNFFDVTRSEGRPPTYFLILKVLNFFTDASEAPKIVTAVAAITFFYAIAFSEYLSSSMKLLTFALLPFFQIYFLFSREYPLILATLALLSNWGLFHGKNTKRISIGLLILASFNIFGWIFGFTVFVARLFHVFKKKSTSVFRQKYLRKSFPLLILFLILVTMIPPKGAHVIEPSIPHSLKGVGLKIGYSYQNMFSIREGIIHGELDGSKAALILFPVVGIFLSVLIGVQLWRANSNNFLMYIFFQLLVHAYWIFGHAPMWWHTRLNLLFCLLLASSTIEVKARSVPWLFAIGVLVITSVFALRDLYFFKDFSKSKSAVGIIKRECGVQCQVFVEDHIRGAAISGYLQSPVFFLDKQKSGTHFDWRSPSKSDWNFEDVKENLSSQRDVVVVISQHRDIDPNFVLVGSALGGVWGSEDFYVYKYVP